MSEDTSEAQKMNTPWTIVMVVIGFAISLSSAIIFWHPRFGGYGSAGFVGVMFSLPNVRYVDGWLRKLAIFGVVVGLGAFIAAYVRCVMITGDAGLCGE